MALGTSIGAHFEDAFDAQAGLPYVRDDNVVTPDKAETNKDLDKAELDPSTGLGIEIGYKTMNDPLKKVYITGEDSSQTEFKPPVGGSTEPADAFKSSEGTDPTSRSVISKLTGSDGGERYQTWPERMIRDMITTAHDVGSGKIPMWAMDAGGDFHTSIEGLEAAHKLMPAASSGIHPTIHLRGEGLDALTEGPDVFRQFMASRGSRQESNIHEPRGPNGEFLSERSGHHPSDFDQTPYWETAHGAREAARLESNWSGTNDRVSTTNHVWNEDHTYYDHDTVPLTAEKPSYNTKVQEELEAAKKSDTVQLIQERKGAFTHQFLFASKAGEGHIRLTERHGGKDLHVDMIGTHDQNEGFTNWNASQTFGYKETKSLLKQLMEEFPKAEYISGFRVSGARLKSGGGDADAKMKLPGRGKRSE